MRRCWSAEAALDRRGAGRRPDRGRARGQPANAGSGKPRHVDASSRRCRPTAASARAPRPRAPPRAGHVQRPRSGPPNAHIVGHIAGTGYSASVAPCGRDPHHLAAAVERASSSCLRCRRRRRRADRSRRRSARTRAAATACRLRRRSRTRGSIVRRRVGVVHRAAVGAEREAVADHHFGEHLRQRAIGIEAHQRRRGGVARLVHVAGEEAALRVAAAVVEAMVRRIVRRGGDLAVERAVRCARARSRRAARRRSRRRGAARSSRSTRGIGIAVLRPVAGSKRLSDGALMSTQYSALSRADQTGHSPSFALTSRTQRNDEC